jgi:hypothetical protein
VIDYAADANDPTNTRSRLLTSGTVMLACAIGLGLLAWTLFRHSIDREFIPESFDPDPASGRSGVRGGMQLGALAAFTLAGILGYGAAASFRSALTR